MPFRKPNSPYWKIRQKNLPGYGDSGTLSARTKNRKLAEAMERMLIEIAEQGLTQPRYHKLLDALRPASRGHSGTITLPDLLKAKHEGRLHELAHALEDPLLTDAVAEYRPFCADTSEGYGLDLLLELAPSTVRARPTRLTYLRSSRNILRLLYKAETEGRRHGSTRNGKERPGLKRNTVRRGLYTAISKLLRHHLGSAERDAIFADVTYPMEDDARDVHLSPSEIAHLLRCCEAVDLDMQPSPMGHESPPPGAFVAMVRLALVTGADRAPLQRLQAKDVQIIAERGRFRGTVYLRDRKTATRPRTMAITHEMCRVLLPLLDALEPTDPVFPLSNQHLRYRWTKARKAFGMPSLRFKDLRHQFGGHADKAGLSLSGIQGAMGHKSRTTSLRYVIHQSVLDTEAAEMIEQQMGLSAPEKRPNRKAG